MELSGLKGVGPATLQKLRAMGITSLRELFYYQPYRYEDQTTVTPTAEIREGASFLVFGVVHEKPKISYFHGISVVTATMADAAGTVHLRWYNEPWMVAQLPLHSPVYLYGPVRRKNRTLILQNAQIVKKPGWVPVYRALRGIPARTFRKLIYEAMQHLEEVCPETLPDSFRNRHELCDLSFALRQIHFPGNAQDLLRAGRRLSFENMLMYLTEVASGKNNRQAGFPMAGCNEFADAFWKMAGFPPTAAQRRVLLEIAADLGRGTAMARLVQGDVGCGKTAIAFGAIYMCCRSGYQAAMMAPTEILARQHYENAKNTLQAHGMTCRLLTGSTRAAERKKILAELASGECNVIFGTHALISEGVHYRSLGLVITDEQHRFGVRQRSRLQEKGRDGEVRLPHVLVMSATPIPRTLALILFGDLDLSVIDEMPPGRKRVRTFLVPETRREDMYHFVTKQIKKGNQAYIVCPLVDDSEEMDQIRSAKSVFEELSKKELKDVRLALTWGGQKSEEKARVLKEFTDGNIDVLVSTTVIEVGVNVPNAVIMIIENAERYGLSQLHQLRGRVGRGTEDSWCFLLSEQSEKLKILCNTDDGFVIAQKDLELRGPGDLMGTRQSGEAIQGVLVNGDTQLLDEVSRAVKELFENPAFREEKEIIQALSADFLSSNALHIALN